MLANINRSRCILHRLQNFDSQILYAAAGSMNAPILNDGLVWRRFAQTDIKSVNSIVTESPFREKSWLKKGLSKLGIGEANKFALRRATVYQYEACTDRLELDNFFTHLKLPDTLYSFYLITQLHVWMCQTTSMKHGPEGRILRNEIMERMWHDMDVRLSKLEVFSARARKKLLKDLLYHHQGAIFSYDEGLLTDDKTLANALWRTLFSKAEVDPAILELCVKYVRTQVKHLSTLR